MYHSHYHWLGFGVCFEAEAARGAGGHQEPLQRGSNENTNGLVIDTFLKKETLEQLAKKKLIYVMERLNKRPAKRLGFKTPNQVFGGETSLVAPNYLNLG